jgi:hypothetical protein
MAEAARDRLPGLVGYLVAVEVSHITLPARVQETAVDGVLNDLVGAFVAGSGGVRIASCHARSLKLRLKVIVGRVTDIVTDVAPADAFAELMNKAREAGDDQAAEAPYGFKADGTPKKAAGRPRRSPSVDELKTPSASPTMTEGDEGGAADQPSAAPPADRAPDEGKRTRVRGSRVVKRDVSRETVPAYKPGIITSGVNRLYRRAGKIVRAMDHDIGTAILESARNTADPGEPDDSVGAAWDELCKTNPRIRKFVMKCLAGGAWGQLVMAHAPIAMAIIMKPAVLRLIPFQALITSMAEPDEDTAPGEGGLPGGMTAADAEQMANLAQQQMERMGMNVPPEVAAQMAAMAQGMMAPEPPRDVSRETPAAFVRRQPRRPGSRSARAKAG